MNCVDRKQVVMSTDRLIRTNDDKKQKNRVAGSSGREGKGLRFLMLVVSIAAMLLAVGPSYSGTERPSSEIGIDERLGGPLALDIQMTDGSGSPVLLRDLVKRPTVFSFVYYKCSHTCPLLLTGLADVLSKVQLSPGKDFSVVTISFDDTDTPALAAEKRNDYIKAAGRAFPEHSWEFLTGDQEAIRKITASAGFRFKKTQNGFSHPVGIIVVSPEGKITRYLYGVKFLPMDLSLAITEASKGLAVPTVNRVLLYCYSYDPEGRRYVFNVLKVTAVVTIFFIVVFISWLTMSVRRASRKTDERGKRPADDQ